MLFNSGEDVPLPLSAMGSVCGHISEETPEFKVREVTENYEIRDYARTYAIQTTDGAENAAFGKLAGYIGVMVPPLT